jgi:unsaturated pyranuronate lyase
VGKNAEHRHVGDREPVEMFPGLFRSTLCYNDDVMLCRFVMKKGAKIPLHHHVAAQNGYMIRGRVRFFSEKTNGFVATPGMGYLFDSDEQHGAEALEDSEFIECFTPMRPEYADDMIRG